MRILFLDDDAERHKRFAREHIGCDVVPVWSAAQAIDALEESVAAGRAWDLISLDHDLTEEQQLACIRDEPIAKAGEGTGYDVALWMEAHPVNVSAVVIHSFNPTGAERMAAALRKYGAYRWPFGTWKAHEFAGRKRA